ncbi:MAG: phenylphosphate carboxylase subunit delta [Xanthomonadaceae bacterium]|nr:phenylphosphate carboxylase subunit delta [Xanthomonadaceae bacterium]MDP2185118.1 phenylphosphate carboxylase subunit delta [Xanthomonadales bacterium]MDZ4115528.1 phenylphosphate carboxylase subunit delta [Xanthomonadaceae bacterium]MDZ4379020.1 phenylphosphate carboxylase subunit delta [Xanthomonadaceae bacterium]
MTANYPPNLTESLLQRARGVRLAAFDVDGTLTDGRLHYGQNGAEAKAFHAHDGLGLKLLAQTGISIALITARNSPIVAARAAELGITLVFQGVHDKAECLRALCTEQGLLTEQAAFMGDDLPDLGALCLSGLAAGPANAHALLRPYLHWRADRAGGDGAARELCDLILHAQGQIERIVARFAPA